MTRPYYLNGTRIEHLSSGHTVIGEHSPPKYPVWSKTEMETSVSIEPKENKKVTQLLIDNIFSCIDGYGILTYALEDCKFIQKTIYEAHGVFMSIAECQKFWKWRSGLWDSSFLQASSKDEVLEYFNKWLEENDISSWE